MTAPEPKLVIPVVPRNAPKAIVIGAGLGGLSAAMRLGAKGYRVTIIDRLDRLGGRGSSVAKNGYRFDLGPTILTVPDVFRRLWTDCGRDFDADVNITPVDPYYEIRWQDGSKFQIRDSQADMDAEVRRIFQSDFAGYQRFLKDCEKRYTFGFEGLGRRPLNKLWDLVKELPGFVALRADRSVYAHAAARVKDPRFRMALSFHPLFIGGDPRHVTSMYILVSHLEKAFGVHYVQGGVQALADAMGRFAERQGARISLGTTVDEITLKDRRVTGVTLSDGRHIAADLVVSNADPGWTYDKLLRKAPRKRWNSAKLARARWSMGLFVWYFGTRGTRDQWSDMGHHTIINGPRYRELLGDIFDKVTLADDMSLYLHRPSVTDPSVAPAGDDCFYALSPVPNLKSKNPVDWAQEKNVYLEKMRTVLNGVIPGFSEKIAAQHVLTPMD